MSLPRFIKSRAFIYSVALHVIVLVLLVTNLELGSKPAPLPATKPLIQAKTVDLAAIEAEKQRKAEAQKRAEAERQRVEEEKKNEAERKRREAERKKREAEAAEKRRQQEAAEKKREAEEQKRREAERARLEAEKKKQEEARLKAEQEKQALEKRRQEALEKKRKEAQELAEKKKAEEEAARKRALAEALAAEEREIEQANQKKRDEAEIAKYIAAIRSKVTGVFIYPDLERGLSCTLYVRMIPGGEVVEARVTDSSGNAAFDRQAENAVRKAAPLPVPQEPRLFDRMREIRFVFAPSD